MKLRQILVGIVPCLSLVLTSQAQTTNVLDWQFSTFSSPSGATPPGAPTAATTINPSGGNPTANFPGVVSINNYNYVFGTGPEGLYGTRTGLWDMQNSQSQNTQLQLKLNLLPASLLDYTLVITHFIDSGGFFPGTFSFSVPNAQFDSRTAVEGGSIGVWVADTYHWSQLSFPGTIELDISPGAGNGHLLLDEVQFIISGQLVAVPEPGISQMVATGLLAFGIGSWFRRKRS